MPYFHATFRRNLPGILASGLGAGGKPNWPGIETGVYLAEHPAICFHVMIEHYLKFGDPGSRPADHLNEIVFLVVDDSRIRPEILDDDPSLERNDVRLYRGVIDVTGMPILSVDEVMAGMDDAPVDDDEAARAP